MNRYTFFEEKQALETELRQFLEKEGNDVLEYYLNNGFDALAVNMRIFNDFQRQMLFDYLMIERHALLECIRRNKLFFIKLIAEGRGEEIRPMLGITDSKYSSLWAEAIDLLSLYFVEKKVIEKMTNFELEKFFTESIFGKDGDTNSKDDAGQGQ